MTEIPLVQRHYCSNVIIRCMDFRNISNGTMVAFAQKHLNGNLCDVISTAGPAKKLADREKHEAIMDDLRLAIKAHHVSHVFLLSHTDCGYYGGSQRFASPKDEIRMLSNDLRQARLTLLGTFPQLKTSLFLAIYQDSDIKIKEITA